MSKRTLDETCQRESKKTKLGDPLSRLLSIEGTLQEVRRFLRPRDISVLMRTCKEYKTLFKEHMEKYHAYTKAQDILFPSFLAKMSNSNKISVWRGTEEVFWCKSSPGYFLYNPESLYIDLDYNVNNEYLYQMQKILPFPPRERRSRVWTSTQIKLTTVERFEIFKAMIKLGSHIFYIGAGNECHMMKIPEEICSLEFRTALIDLKNKPKDVIKKAMKECKTPMLGFSVPWILEQLWTFSPAK